MSFVAAVRPHFERILQSPILANIRAGHYSLDELKALAALSMFAVFLFCVIRGRRLGCFALLWYYWFMATAAISLVLESYWIVAGDRIANGTGVLDAVWRMYGAFIDSRILSFDADFRTVLTFSSLLGGPLSLLVAHSIQQELFFQYPAQIVVSTARMCSHAFFLFSNLSKGFVYTAAEENRALLVKAFVLYHAVYIVLSALSIFRAMYKCESLNASFLKGIASTISTQSNDELRRRKNK